MSDTVRKIVMAELRAKTAEHAACPRSKTAVRIRLAREMKELEREVEQLDRSVRR